MNQKLIAVILILQLPEFTFACSRKIVHTSPPKLINNTKTSNSEKNIEQQPLDLNQLLKNDYDFIFSGTYNVNTSHEDAGDYYIDVKEVWRGKVPNHIKLNQINTPTQNICTQHILIEDKTFMFFAKLGNRKNPVQVKTFRKTTPELKALLGKPKRQWLRGRLIHNK